jgi:hypothetical protein
MGDDNHPRVRFKGSQPLLPVEDMEGTLQFCGDVSGFENATRDSEEFTSVSRDRAAIYLCQGDRGPGWGVGLNRCGRRRKAP